MNEQDLKVQRLTRDMERIKKDLAKWKNRALEAAGETCRKCSEVNACEACRMKEILEDAENEK